MGARQFKVLRLGVIQGGKIVEERILTTRQAVTIGTSARNTIVVPISNLPESFTAFTLHGDAYHLCFEEGMDGRVQDDRASADLASLVVAGKARKEGKGHAVPVADSQRGRLTLGEVTLLWQFVPLPPEAPRPVLPPDARGNHFKSLDRLFATVLAASVLLLGGAYMALATADLPPEVSVEQVPVRSARLLMPVRLPAPPAQAQEEARLDSGDIDQARLGAFVRARMGPIKACHEHALKRNPSLKGQVVIHFTILATGGVANVGVSQDSLGATDVATCIVNSMRSWRTPFRPGGPVAVEYPFLFTPSN